MCALNQSSSESPSLSISSTKAAALEQEVPDMPTSHGASHTMLLTVSTSTRTVFGAVTPDDFQELCWSWWLFGCTVAPRYPGPASNRIPPIMKEVFMSLETIFYSLHIWAVTEARL